MKVDCSALSRSRNPHPYSQSGLSASLLIRVSPSDIHETLHVRVYLKIHSCHLHAPLRGIFAPNSVSVARYAAFICNKSPTKCDIHLAESNFQTHSSMLRLMAAVRDFHDKYRYRDSTSSFLTVSLSSSTSTFVVRVPN